MAIDWNKPIRTVDTHNPCRVLATDLLYKHCGTTVVVAEKQGEHEEIHIVGTNGVVAGALCPLFENVPPEPVTVSLYTVVQRTQGAGWVFPAYLYYTEEAAALCQDVCDQPNFVVPVTITFTPPQ